MLWTQPCLVVLLGQLDRTCESSRRLLETASNAQGLAPEFVASAASLATQADCWMELLDAEIERRLK